ncbi:MAG: hypothetical protein JKX76_05125 [Colwellia sp.]|nr:hypothetical protein [Colwellia sp.]
MLDKYLKPLEQLFQLNAELIPNLEELSSYVHVVGGQAVAYWINYYSSDIKFTDEEQLYVQSADIDYVALNTDIKLLAKCWNVDVSYADNHPPPSLAILLLKNHDKIKETADGHLFLDVDKLLLEEEVKSNLVDIIDRPAGFDEKAFKLATKLEIYTTPFIFPESFKIQPQDKLRILTPLGCIRSRIANLFYTQKPKDIEVARIKVLMEPTFFHIQDLIADNGFKHTKRYIDDLRFLVLSKDSIKLYLRYGVDLRILYSSIAHSPGVPDVFIENEFRLVTEKMDIKYERLRLVHEDYLKKSKT